MAPSREYAEQMMQSCFSPPANRTNHPLDRDCFVESDVIIRAARGGTNYSTPTQEVR